MSNYARSLQKKKKDKERENRKDPPAMAFSGRRRSSVVPPEGLDAPPPTSSSGSLVAPRKASTWDSMPAPHGNPTASDISARRASATNENSTGPPPENSAVGSIGGRKASSWDEPPHVGGVARSSVSDIAGRKATAMDRPPWDRFAGAPPAYEGSTWGWMTEIAAITSSAAGRTVTARNRLFYIGNLNYIFDNFNGQSLAMDDLKAVMYAYGVNPSGVEDVAKKVDPQTHGIFVINSHNTQVLLTTNVSFSDPTDPLNNLRQASKCFQRNLLAPLHFAGYIFDILIASGCLGGQSPFMLLGMYGILGVLGASTNQMLTTRDVETFISLWKVLNPDEAQDLKSLINDDYNGTISCMGFYNMLYRRNAFGKQRIEMFDSKGPYDPSLFFPLLDKDKDGFLLPTDLCSFAAIFGRAPSNEAIHHVTRKLDLDGDGKINYEDFCQAMMPVLDGMTWEFWLVGIMLTFKL